MFNLCPLRLESHDLMLFSDSEKVEARATKNQDLLSCGSRNAKKSWECQQR